MSVLRERFANNATTSLASSANTTTTSLSLTDASAFPSVGNFRIKADSEIMLCTARSSNTLTVARAQEGTTAASHSGGATVSHTLTAAALQQLGYDNVPGWNTAPPAGVYDSSGNRIDSSAFTWVNQGSATTIDNGQQVGIFDPTRTSGENLRILALSAPATPYSVVANINAMMLGATVNCGICFRNSSSGKVSALAIKAVNSGPPEFHVYQWTNPTTFDNSANIQTAVLISGNYWLKITDDGTNTIYYVGCDGVNWVQIYSESRTAFVTPNQVGFYSNNYNGTNDAVVKVNSFSFA